MNGSDAIRDSIAVRRLVGFLPEQPPLYPDMTVFDYLCFAGRLRGMAPADVTRRTADVEELTDVKAVRGELIRHLSQGYRQRVGLAQALIHEPELLILDEPAHDLDPAQIVEMRALLGTLREHHTILVSSHNLPEISQTCDRLLFVDGGEIIASGSETRACGALVGYISDRGGDPTPQRQERDGFRYGRRRDAPGGRRDHRAAFDRWREGDHDHGQASGRWCLDPRRVRRGRAGRDLPDLGRNEGMT